MTLFNRKIIKKLQDAIYNPKLFLNYFINRFPDRLVVAFGIARPKFSSDRVILEQSIFPLINKFYGHQYNILFIGCSDYTWHYVSLLKGNFYTIDFDPRKAIFGSKGKHIVGSALDLDLYYNNKFFNVIIANGLIGYGVNSEAEFNSLCRSVFNSLQHGGIFVIGYNDNRVRLNFNIFESEGFNLFQKYSVILNKNNSFIHDTESTDHRYIFLQKE
jgi:SAM-dependent methyltransferase